MSRNHRFRCVLCGHVVMERNLDRAYDMDIFKLRGLGRARGFALDPILDPGLVTRIKNKIRALFERFFEPVYPSIKLFSDLRVATPVLSKPSILVMPVVRKYG